MASLFGKSMRHQSLTRREDKSVNSKIDRYHIVVTFDIDEKEKELVTIQQKKCI
jgi:hypothetical protein